MLNVHQMNPSAISIGPNAYGGWSIYWHYDGMADVRIGNYASEEDARRHARLNGYTITEPNQ